MSKVTVKRAAQLIGKSRETINKATNAGKLSTTRNASNLKVIDIAELERVYPLVKTIDEIEKESVAVTDSQKPSPVDAASEVNLLKLQLGNSQEMIELLSKERDREREQLTDELERLRASLAKAEDQNKNTLLLITDQTKQTKERQVDWEQFQNTIEKRLAEHEERSQQDQDKIRSSAKQAIAKLRGELEAAKTKVEAERNKPWFKKLFAGNVE